VKSGAQETKELQRMHHIHEITEKKQQQVNKRWAGMEAINFFMLTRMLLVAIGIYLFAHDLVSLGLVYFFQTSFFRVLTPFEMLGGMLPQWNKNVGRVRLAEELLNTRIDVQNVEHPTVLAHLRGEIVFEQVSFAYAAEKVLVDEDDFDAVPSILTEEASITTPEEQQPMETKEIVNAQEEKAALIVSDEEHIPVVDQREVLRGIDLHIKPGEHIALVGHSGAGKSTIAMILNRFYDVTGGRITIDGVDLREIDVHWWRSQIGLVLQDNLMFNDTVLENIRYARPDATEAEVKEAAQRAAAHEFIEKMPSKYQTIIGDRGIRLSGGQRQRVAIARAILKKPNIVVLDEATSALDSITERLVQDGIKELVEGRTAVIIAHRLSTVRSVDRIAVMEDGRVTAFAPHEELLKISPVYKEMVELQKEGILAE
jgi:ABC-type multidrug transport system fused ATPase/permease subunit